MQFKYIKNSNINTNVTLLTHNFSVCSTVIADLLDIVIFTITVIFQLAISYCRWDFQYRPSLVLTYIYYLWRVSTWQDQKMQCLHAKGGYAESCWHNNSSKANCTGAYQIGFHHSTLRFESIDDFLRNSILLCKHEFPVLERCTTWSYGLIPQLRADYFTWNNC